MHKIAPRRRFESWISIFSVHKFQNSIWSENFRKNCTLNHWELYFLWYSSNLCNFLNLTVQISRKIHLVSSILGVFTPPYPFAHDPVLKFSAYNLSAAQIYSLRGKLYRTNNFLRWIFYKMLLFSFFKVAFMGSQKLERKLQNKKFTVWNGKTTRNYYNKGTFFFEIYFSSK